MFWYTDREFLLSEMKRLNERYNKCFHDYQANPSHANWIRICEAQEEFAEAFKKFRVLEDSDNVGV